MKNRKVKAEMWKISICKNGVSYAHGFFQTINEFYIPKYNVSFSVNGGFGDKIIYAFKPTEQRYGPSRAEKQPDPVKIVDIEIDEKFAKDLKKYVELKEDMYDRALVQISRTVT